jgi:3',5'-cyclic AMP phosphodiesterase CpdA
MTSFPQLRVLHVSDLHFGRKHVCNPTDPTGASAGIRSLKDLLLKDLASDVWREFEWTVPESGMDQTPLLLAATGDLTQTAGQNDATEFDKAREFLSGLASAPILGSEIGLRNVFVVPGNHDVIFDQKDPKQRFAPYCTFYNELFKSIQPELRDFARPEEARSLSQIHTFPEARFLVAEINSCFYVEKDSIDQSRGQVDVETISSLREQLKEYSEEAEQWIKIAIIHHHPVLLPSFIEPGRGVDSVVNAKSLLRLLRDNSFQLILHGHKHYPQVFSYDPDSAWASARAAIPQMIVAGGSCGSAELPEAKQKCNTYNLITVKWNPNAYQARFQVVTRGLIRVDDEGEIDSDLWRWETMRVFDKTLSPYENVPLPGKFKRISFPSKGDALEENRDEIYQKLRFNMPVIDVRPSLQPTQGYEARVWLERHRHHKESPARVIWSAGPMFERKVSEADAAPDFCTSFHYWGPMLIQAQLEFKDGETAVHYLYARLPDTTRRR